MFNFPVESQCQSYDTHGVTGDHHKAANLSR